MSPGPLLEEQANHTYWDFLFNMECYRFHCLFKGYTSFQSAEKKG